MSFDKNRKRHSTVPWPFRDSYEIRFGDLAEKHDEAYDDAKTCPTQGQRYDKRLAADRDMLIVMESRAYMGPLYRLYYKVTPYGFKLNHLRLNWIQK